MTKNTERPTLTPAVKLIAGRGWTNTLALAGHLGQRHQDLLRRIRKLDCSEEFKRENFVAREYLGERGRYRVMYEINRSGFDAVIGGRLSKEGRRWVFAYFDAFNLIDRAYVDYVKAMAVSVGNLEQS